MSLEYALAGALALLLVAFLTLPRAGLAVLLIVLGLAGAAAALLYYAPAYLAPALAVAGVLALLALARWARRRSKAAGGTGFWLRGLASAWRPALGHRARARKAARLEALRSEADRAGSRRRRAAARQAHALAEREAAKIQAAVAALAQKQRGLPGASVHRTETGVHFCRKVEQPFAHTQLVALYAAAGPRQGRGLALVYCVRRGQMLEGKPVFQGYQPAREFSRLRQAVSALARELAQPQAGAR